MESGAAPEGLRVRSVVWARFRDGTERRAIVIDRAYQQPVPGLDASDPAAAGGWKYYVHYTDFNRRMDTWLSAPEVRPDVGASATAGAPAAHGKMVVEDVSHHHAGAGKSGGGSAHAGAGGEEIIDSDGTRLHIHKRNDNGELVIDFVEPDHEGDGMTEESIREHEEVTKVKNVNFIELGKYRMETWYFSPLPKEYWPSGVTDTLYFCEFCLKFFRFKTELRHHAGKCTWRHPPGDEIYRGKDGIGMWEIDGIKEKQYCQNLAYLAKMFLDHKTLVYDVDLFFFYVMTELDEYGYHIVGYFSKEKYSEVGYNLACILCFPSHQRKGYGRFLIQFSYELSKIEKKVGSPEKPLSDLGLLSYRSYWSWVLLDQLRHSRETELSIMDLVERTSMKFDDVYNTLQHLGFIRYLNGQHVFTVPSETVEKEFARLNSKPGPVVDPLRIHWAPYRPPIKRDKWLISSKRAAAFGNDYS